MQPNLVSLRFTLLYLPAVNACWHQAWAVRCYPSGDGRTGRRRPN